MKPWEVVRCQFGTNSGRRGLAGRRARVGPPYNRRAPDQLLAIHGLSVGLGSGRLLFNHGVVALAAAQLPCRWFGCALRAYRSLPRRRTWPAVAAPAHFLIIYLILALSPTSARRALLGLKSSCFCSLLSVPIHTCAEVGSVMHWSCLQFVFNYVVCCHGKP